MISSSPFLSIIIPVYNLKEFIADCLTSCLNQNIDDYEIICIDDGSIDDSAAIIEEIAKKNDRVRLFRKENGGVSSARNYGIDVSRGEWLWFVDGDDFVVENCLKSIKESIRDEHELVFFDSERPFNYIKSELSESLLAVELNSENFFDLRPKKCYGGGAWSYWLKRRVVVNNSLYFDSSMKYSEDVKFLFQYRCSCNRKGLVLDNTIYFYRNNNSSAMHNVDYTQHFNCMEILFNTYYREYVSSDPGYFKNVCLNKVGDAIQAIQFDLLFKLRDYAVAKQRIGFYKASGVFPVKRVLTEFQKKERKEKNIKQRIRDFLVKILFNRASLYLFACKLMSRRKTNENFVDS